MDSDRKSTVSSFYGHRGSSDALNDEYHQQRPSQSNYESQAQARYRDDASSFYNPTRASRHLDGAPTERYGAAGYNKNSFHMQGREEPLKGGQDEEAGSPAWDIYADFNNAGPRYSSFGPGGNGYQPVGSPSITKGDDVASTTGGAQATELVTVPAMGPEWGKDELHGLTSRGKKERKSEARRERWKQWNRGNTGMCGRHFTRKTAVFVGFGFCVVIGILLAIMIPRVPGFGFSATAPLGHATGSFNASIPTMFSVAPANFSFAGVANLQIDTGDNILPLTFNHLRATVFDSNTNRQVGSGDLGHYTLPAKAFTAVALPLNFTYVATNNSDATWVAWHAACQSKVIQPDGKRPPVQFRIILDMDIAGLPGSHKTSTEVPDADCPIELSPQAS